MLSFIRRKLAGLSGCTSGNATIIVALGMPMLIGGAGLGVDVTQWYMWKRELQFAVDQAAVAGAWTRLDASPTVQATYQARALQEYNANLDIVDDFDTAPVIGLADYAPGLQNSVRVTATATKELPFSSLVTGESATIAASAQAVFEAGSGEGYSVCMLALDPSASPAFTLGGSADGDAECGFGALSNAVLAMKKNGNPDAQAGSLVSAGGIDEGFIDNGAVHAHVNGLSDPFGSLPNPVPASSPSRTYTCPEFRPASTTTTATTTPSTIVSYVYVTGNNSNQARSHAEDGTDLYDYNPKTAGSTTVGASTNDVTVSNGTVSNSYTDSAPSYTYVRQVLSSPKVHEVRKTVIRTTYTNVVAITDPGSDGIARPQPGSYSSIEVTCQTIFAPGIYVVSGSLDFGQNQAISGTGGLMFVLTSPGNMHINSNSNITLSGITASTLQNQYGWTAANAEKMAGMLIYDKQSTDQWKVNGNASVAMNGILYMPKREVWFNGNSTVSGSCLMIAAGRITFTGNNDISSFCIPTGFDGMDIGGGSEPTVRLVA
jgi:Flp pilus assembly protein TadG